jgi:hypothetical protein
MRRLPPDKNAHRFPLAVLLLPVLLLAGCWQQPIETRLPTPNPNPVERYRVTVEVTNAPGEFTSAEGLVRFQMTDATRRCVPLQPNGATAAATAGLEMPFELRKTSATTFEGEAVLDPFVPHDDYGLGPCDWQTIGVGARLSNGTNVHSVDTQLSLPGSGFEAGDDRYRVADGRYRGRRAFTLDTFSADRLLPGDPPPKPDDPLPFFSGGYSDSLKPIDPSRFSERYFITVTAERMDPSP